MKKKLLPLIIAAVTASSMSFATEIVRLGVEPGYAPFEIKKPDGSLAGFDIDLGNEICKRIEAQCRWIESDFDGLIPSLKAKKIDAILSAMSITDARLEEIAFSHKLYGTPARLVTAKGLDLQPTAAALGGKRIGVFQGTTAETYAKEQWAVKGVDVVTYQSQDLVYADLINGRLDGAFQDAVAADDGFLKRSIGKHFQFSGPEVNNKTYFGVGAGIGLRQEDSELKAKINQAIDSMLADGTYSEIASKYFNFDIYGK
ncbi:histidine ABC transporter substrate-binding protein HisJ [Psychromonas sp. MB-3u-54]|uniref:ABC transporter substrate-binding protein n=1 Tax=Psychromonas sp. MB-3u-54 TaxID=2058319 RepID=UPI000C33D88A|nr:ABC transporter substrate-binding protein [Psychromonas sp. MB-3u-54]PKH02827.1 histidine ABC transporter substrate-binding protein HisJ [Psychromonas sp. MB-3u-54]